jgi:hypothetical protein
MLNIELSIRGKVNEHLKQSTRKIRFDKKLIEIGMQRLAYNIFSCESIVSNVNTFNGEYNALIDVNLTVEKLRLTDEIIDIINNQFIPMIDGTYDETFDYMTIFIRVKDDLDNKFEKEHTIL